MSEDAVISLDPHLQEKLHTFPTVSTNTQKAAEQIAEMAKDLSMEHYLTGRYREGIIVNKPTLESRGVARVLATDQKSSWMEFGNYQHPGYMILRNAVELCGYSFKKK